MRHFWLLLIFALFSASAPAQQAPDKDDGGLSALPPGQGSDLVQTDCTSCHTLKVVFQARKSQPDWAKTLDDMIQRGAAVFPEEIDPITSYLSKNFGAATPPLLNVNTATREELEKLPNLKPELARRVLEARTKAGPFKNSEDLRRALGMDKDEFARSLYLLKYN